MSNITAVIRGGLWLYMRSLITNMVGFFYWFIISAIAGPSVVGLTSTTMSLALTVFGLVTLGTNIGVQRFIGACRGKGDHECSSRYFWSVALYNLIIYLVVGTSMVIMGLSGLSIYNIKGDMLFYAGLMVIFNSSLLFDPLLISYLETKPLFIATVLGQAIRVPVGVGLVYIGWGWIGAFIGILASMPISLIVKLRFVLKIVKPKLRIYIDTLKDVLKAGLANWLPSTITLLGQQLGVLTLFGIKGAIETGLYYVAFSIMSVIQGIGISILQLMLPVLSGMSDGRKRATVRAIRIILALVSPLAFVLAVYSYVPLSLLGKSFIAATPILMLLSISIPATFIVVGVNSLVYAYGLYGMVLVLGLAMNLSRILSYVPLSLIMSGIGTALSYALGSYIALIVAAYICRKIKLEINYKEILIIIVFPLVISILMWAIKIHWLVGSLIILLSSYVLYFKMRIITRKDIRDLVYALFSKHAANKIYKYFQPLIDWLIGQD